VLRWNVRNATRRFVQWTQRRPEAMLAAMNGLHRSHWWILAGVFASLPTNSTPAAPDIELGRYLSAECVTCHRGGTVRSAIPNIYGLSEGAFAEVLKAYRDKRLNNAVMQNIAGRLKDEEIEALAAYFARTKRP
jgi:cytochrome c